jgi:hypothetical protein
MKHSLTKLCLLLSLLGSGATFTLPAQTTAFTYQGRLTTGGNPASGSHDFQFMLFDAANGGAPVGNAVNASAIGVTNGVFTVPLDFGAAVFNGADRWLAIAVRPAGGGAFTPLTPRQPITPTPYALTALSALTASSVPGVSGHALHAADGNPQNAVFVNDAGNVGVGTISPGSQFHVVSRPDEAAPPRLQSIGNNRFNAGWDFYHGGTGRGYVGVPDANAGVAPGELVLFGGPGVKASLWGGQIRALTTDTAGNVGIGTDTPAARLDVRGDIRMGPSGAIRATGGEENLRIVRGVVNAEGAILEGAGFTVSRPRNGYFDIRFNSPFAGAPALTATADYAREEPFDVMVKAVTATTARVVVYQGDTTIHFIAIGPR